MPSTPTNRPFPSWRKIESVLIELLREEGLDIEQERGESFITLYYGDNKVTRINLGDFAQQLEERL